MFSFPTISHIKTRPQLFYSFTAEDGSAETAPSTADLFSTSFLLSNTSWHLQITRLLPESDFISGQLEDIRDLSKWMHEDLSNHLSQNGPRTSIEDVIVAGASAGALLALLTVSS